MGNVDLTGWRLDEDDPLDTATMARLRGKLQRRYERRVRRRWLLRRRRRRLMLDLIVIERELDDAPATRAHDLQRDRERVEQLRHQNAERLFR